MADANHEVEADCFAFASLDEPDRKRAAAFLRKYPVTDAKLSPPFEKGRRDFLTQNINAVEADEGLLVHHQASGKTPHFVWGALAATAVLSCFMRRPDWLALPIQTAILALSLAFLLATAWKDWRLKQAIEWQLEARHAWQ